MIREIVRTMRDIHSLGMPVLGRFLNTPSSQGFKKVDTRYGTYWVRPRQSDLTVIRHVYDHHPYDLSKVPQWSRIKAHYDSIVESGRHPIIIDAGANIGVSSRYFAAIFPKAKIFAVEPDPHTIDVCRLNTKDEAAIQVIEAAIGSTAGNVVVESFDGAAWGTRTHRAESGLAVVTVPQITDSVADGTLFFVKIDIEGFESDLFGSNVSWIDDAYVISIEPHDWLFPNNGTSQSMQNVMLGKNRDLIISGENLIWIKRG